MNLNKKLNLKLKNEIHLIDKWKVEGDNIWLTFSCNKEECFRIQEKLNKSRFFTAWFILDGTTNKKIMVTKKQVGFQETYNITGWTDSHPPKNNREVK